MEQIRPKTCYHPFVLIAFHLNCLPDNLLQAIPRSTRFDWVHRDIQESFGFGWYQENKNLFLTLELISQNKKLLKINRALLRILALKAFLKNHAAAIAAGLGSIRMTAAGNILKLSHLIGLRKALKYLDLDFKYYAKLRNRLSACHSSIYNLCLVKHPSTIAEKGNSCHKIIWCRPTLFALASYLGIPSNKNGWSILSKLKYLLQVCEIIEIGENKAQ
jgi:putative transposase